MWSTSMTVDEMLEAAERQRKLELNNARMWRDHYQRLVDELEARAPLKNVPTERKT